MFSAFFIIINYHFNFIFLGRTGRCQQAGTSFTFFTPGNAKQANELLSVLKEAGQLAPEDLIRLAQSSRNGFHMSRKWQEKPTTTTSPQFPWNPSKQMMPKYIYSQTEPSQRPLLPPPPQLQTFYPQFFRAPSHLQQQLQSQSQHYPHHHHHHQRAQNHHQQHENSFPMSFHHQYNNLPTTTLPSAKYFTSNFQ